MSVFVQGWRSPLMRPGDFKKLCRPETERPRQQQMWKRLFAGIQQAHRAVVKTAGILDMVFAGLDGLDQLRHQLMAAH